MISLGRYHIAYDAGFDLTMGFMGRFSFPLSRGNKGWVYHFGRIVWMVLPRGKHV